MTLTTGGAKGLLGTASAQRVSLSGSDEDQWDALGYWLPSSPTFSDLLTH